MTNTAPTEVRGEAKAPELDFAKVLEQYEGALWRLAAGYLERPADREDLFQEIAVGLWQALPRYRGDASLRTFVYRVAHNVAITHATRVRKRSRSEEPLQAASSLWVIFYLVRYGWSERPPDGSVSV